MPGFKRRKDPLSDRAKTLNAEIAALEAQIRHLNQHMEQAEHQPRLRSTAHPGPPSPHPPLPKPAIPVFEPLDRQRAHAPGETITTADHYNEQGVRKYDLPALWRWIRHQFSGPSARKPNPTLVNYLAAGAVQGLRPMRYEKRLARNRLLGLALILAIVLYGIIYVLSRR